MAGDYETLIDDVISAHSRSRGGLWDCARSVWELYDRYGMYERDFTATLCRELGIQADSLYHWRKAWDLRRAIVEAFPGFELGSLSISHFYNAADYVERLGLEAVYDWLVIARDAGLSSRRLAAELSTACDDSGTAAWFYSRLGRVFDRLGKLYGSAEQAGLPDRKRRRLRRVLMLLDGLINQK